MTKILVIEDEPGLRREVADWLTLEGYETFVSGDGVEGIKLAFRHQPDLIICDITMPRMGGYEVLMELRTNPTMADTPFIFITARASREDIRKGMDLGADDYLTKPFTRPELLHAIQTRLDKKAIREEDYQYKASQWKQALDQEREQRLLKSKLVAMLSHDFHTPLAVIMLSISILRDYADHLDEQHRLKHLNRAEASVRELMQMLDDMLIISQLETNHFEFRPEPLNMAAFIQKIVDEFQIIHSETYTLIFKSQVTETMMIDPRLLRQIVSNLISNAIKYSPQGSDVEILLEQRNAQIILTIRDQGMGIPEIELPHLFTAFKRGSNVYEIRGTGLGLAIVKQAVDLHGWMIALESKPENGTTVIVSIPLS